MFDDLINMDGFTPLSTATATDVLDAQTCTAAFLRSIGAEYDDPDPLSTAPKQAFEGLVSAAAEGDADRAKSALLQLHTSAEVEQLQEMLKVYNWDFVKQARELRTFTVMRLIEHANSRDSRTSLAALKAIGQICEIGLFTSKVEITTVDTSRDELLSRLKERLTQMVPAALAAPAEHVDDANIISFEARRAAADAGK